MMAKCVDLIYRITVFENDSGIPLFDFINENAEDIGYDEILYSGAMQGLNIIIREAINCGCIKELVLEHAGLLMHHDDSLKVTYIVIVKEISDLMRDLFNVFIKKFDEKYSEIIQKKSLVTKFNGAEILIEEIFPFL